MNNNERSSHPSRAQIDALLEFLERNSSLAKGFSKTANGRDTARKKWASLAVKLNSIGGSSKSWKQWTKYWADKKSAVKKKTALRSAARRKTGGGVEEEVVELTDIEERIVCLMGGDSFAVGDQHLAVNPFSDSQLTEETVTLPPSVGEQSTTGQLADVDIDVNTMADPIPGTSYKLTRQSYLPDVQTISTSPPRKTSPIMFEHTIQVDHHIQPTAPSPRQLPPRSTTPRRHRRPTLSNSPPSQRRSQFNSVIERFLRLEEQRLQQSSRTNDLIQSMTVLAANQIEALTAIAAAQSEASRAIAQGLQAIGEGLKMLAEI